jgi:SAM-dependent methyltransferase
MYTSFFLYFKVKWLLFRERREIRRRFPTFLPFECAVHRAYRFHNPYKICREHLKLKGVYGETPLPVLARIAHECGLNSSDVLFELGCGRGRGAMFLSHLIGCQVIGIDWIPFFIHVAEEIVASVHPRLQVAFRCTEMQTVDFAGATAIFLYGTCLSDEIIGALISRFEALPPQTKIITVSYPLSDYSSKFHTLKQFNATFPWGEGEIFMNVIKGLSFPLAKERKLNSDRDS